MWKAGFFLILIIQIADGFCQAPPRCLYDICLGDSIKKLTQKHAHLEHHPKEGQLLILKDDKKFISQGKHRNVIYFNTCFMPGTFRTINRVFRYKKDFYLLLSIYEKKYGKPEYFKKGRKDHYQWHWPKVEILFVKEQNIVRVCLHSKILEQKEQICRKGMKPEALKIIPKLSPPKVKKVKVIGREGSLTAYSNGVVLDAGTKLMWSAHDSGKDLDWQAARDYCSNFRGGGYSDWRLPRVKELQSLYQGGYKGYTPKCCSICGQVQISDLIQLHCLFVWTADHRKDGIPLIFNFGGHHSYSQYTSAKRRALPVRIHSKTKKK